LSDKRLYCQLTELIKSKSTKVNSYGFFLIKNLIKLNFLKPLNQKILPELLQLYNNENNNKNSSFGKKMKNLIDDIKRKELNLFTFRINFFDLQISCLNYFIIYVFSKKVLNQNLSFSNTINSLTFISISGIFFKTFIRKFNNIRSKNFIEFEDDKNKKISKFNIKKNLIKFSESPIFNLGSYILWNFYLLDNIITNGYEIIFYPFILNSLLNKINSKKIFVDTLIYNNLNERVKK
jgi:hypothetical protein